MAVKYNNAVFLTENATDELFLTLASERGPDFEAEADELMRRYETAISELKCSNETEIFLRFHLSDVCRQAPVLREMLGSCDSFVSFVGQAPAGGGRIALEAWHLRPPDFEKYVTDFNGFHEIDIKLKNYELLYNCCRKLHSQGSGDQTIEEFKALERALKQRGGDVSGNCLRTWIYCRDVDNNYAGLVKARRELFRQYGLIEKTNYIASTGIEGQCEDPRRLIGMDSYSVFGLQPGQLEYMHAPDHLSPTHVYGVTFERGTRIIFGDRSHYYISGTASIDRDGKIVHPGNVSKQTDRTVENIRALLNNHEADLDDLKIAVVYLRDGADADLVEARLQELLPVTLPRIMVKAPVCRPGWLVEIDAIGVNERGNPQYKNFV
jgi:enamine deaminase RidA (YjgF/YER057c/UK114 family)